MRLKLVIFKAISTEYLFTSRKRAVVSVINDLVSDHRVYKICNSLTEAGFEVVLVGRKLRGSPEVPADWKYRAIRMKLLFSTGPLFYISFNIRLLLRLLFLRADLLYANDLDTLLPNFLISRLRRIPLIYDSHELFCEVPELQSSPFKKAIWQKLEDFIVPRLRYCITVNQSIAGILSQRHGVPFTVVRNIPAKPGGAYTQKTRAQLSLPPDKKIIILQGAGINMDRGAEELVEAMKLLDNVFLLIIGSGDVWEILERKVLEDRLQDKIRMIRRVSKQELVAYTSLADVGLTIDKDNNLNYRYSLPNKLFDYIQCGVPVLASRLPEIERIVVQYNIGDFIENHQPDHLAKRITEMLSSDQLQVFKGNCRRAAMELNWDAEKNKLLAVIEAASGSAHNN